MRKLKINISIFKNGLSQRQYRICRRKHPSLRGSGGSGAAAL